MTRYSLIRGVRWGVVVISQLILTQVVTFFLYSLFGGNEDYPVNHPVLFILILGISFAAGILLGGCLALRLKWIAEEPKLLLRLVFTLSGTYLPLVLALIIYKILKPGNPFFLIAILVGITGFYLPGWINGRA